VSGHPSLRLDRDGPVTTLWLDDPATRNAMTFEIADALREVASELAEAPEVRVVVVRGAGGTFCSGGNVGDILRLSEAGSADAVAADNRRFGRMLERFKALPQPVVAVVEGAAFGGGFGLACVADVVLARDDAQFALSEVRLGLIPAQIAPFVSDRIGAARTRELALTGRRFGAEEALRIGLVNSVSSAQTLDDELRRTIGDLLASAPNAVRLTKELVSVATALSLPDALDWAAARFGEAVVGSEGREGLTAFREKRRPSWTAL
jgi:isohexenylglutaconyl-CoA hydratase